ncbi:MAG: hypothetical protein SVQ76_01345 [Candidatus Nanohaloarchaea archaeon]|nr:hypothetical protein [Candidatus Nanohaloarchaea archaeon]
MAVKREGQLFILGMLLFAGMISGIVLLNLPGGLGFDRAEAAKNLFERGLDEYPVMLNTVHSSNSSPEYMQQRITPYLDFQSYTFRTHGLDSSVHAVTLVPEEDNVTLLFSNFHGREVKDLNVSVAGENRFRASVNDSRTVLESFTSLPKRFNVSVKFDAGKSFDHDFVSSTARMKSLLFLKVETENQVWQKVKIY